MDEIVSQTKTKPNIFYFKNFSDHSNQPESSTVTTSARFNSSAQMAVKLARQPVPHIYTSRFLVRWICCIVICMYCIHCCRSSHETSPSIRPRGGTGQIFCNRSGPAGLKICPVRSGRYPARSFSKPNRRKSGEKNGTQTQLVDLKWWRDQIFDIFMSESEVKNPNLGKKLSSSYQNARYRLFKLDIERNDRSDRICLFIVMYKP